MYPVVCDRLKRLFRSRRKPVGASVSLKGLADGYLLYHTTRCRIISPGRGKSGPSTDSPQFRESGKTLVQESRNAQVNGIVRSIRKWELGLLIWDEMRKSRTKGDARRDQKKAPKFATHLARGRVRGTAMISINL